MFVFFFSYCGGKIHRYGVLLTLHMNINVHRTHKHYLSSTTSCSKKKSERQGRNEDEISEKRRQRDFDKEERFENLKLSKLVFIHT